MNKMIWLALVVSLPLRHISLTSPYGYRMHPVTGKYSFHAGVDLRARGDTVFAVLAGKVADEGYNSLLGVYILLEHTDFESSYGHLSQIFVLAGDSVSAGFPIGVTGSSGRVTGEHLHFSVQYRHRYIDPLKFLLELLIIKSNKKGEPTMSTQFKPVSEQVSNKMIADIKSGNSIFQRPNNSMNSAMPFNLESGNKYAGPSALVLLMQKRDDPRWATSNQANRNHTAVLKGATGTMISFHSAYAIQKVVDGKGEPVLKDNGKQRTERVKLDQPELVEAWMFNAEQMRKMEKWEKEPNILSPIERAQLILDNSKAVIEHGGDDMFYDRQTDTIVLPEKDQFAGAEQYYAEALHQLAHWSGAEERLNRPQVGQPGEFTAIREELRTNLASVFLSKELNLPYELNYHEGFTASWSQLMKDEPGELFKAATDAQKIVDMVMKFEQQVEQKQEAEEVVEQDLVEDVAPKFNPDRLTKGEIIPHNGTEFKVLAELKNNVYQMQDLNDKRKFKMGSDTGLFASLIEAKNNSQELVASKEYSPAEEFAAEHGNDNEVNNDYQMQR